MSPAIYSYENCKLQLKQTSPPDLENCSVYQVFPTFLPYLFPSQMTSMMWAKSHCIQGWLWFAGCPINLWGLLVQRCNLESPPQCGACPPYSFQNPIWTPERHLHPVHRPQATKIALLFKWQHLVPRDHTSIFCPKKVVEDPATLCDLLKSHDGFLGESQLAEQVNFRGVKTSYHCHGLIIKYSGRSNLCKNVSYESSPVCIHWSG